MTEFYFEARRPGAAVMCGSVHAPDAQAASEEIERRYPGAAVKMVDVSAAAARYLASLETADA
jgi:hypothetical protein